MCSVWRETRIVSALQTDIASVWIVFGGFTVWKNRRLNRWRKRKNPMKKILILSDSLGGSYSWITLLNALFPVGQKADQIRSKQT